jgi:hypothetical protein
MDDGGGGQKRKWEVLMEAGLRRWKEGWYRRRQLLYCYR